jgi:hypothetical protein
MPSGNNAGLMCNRSDDPHGIDDPNAASLQLTPDRGDICSGGCRADIVTHVIETVDGQDDGLRSIWDGAGDACKLFTRGFPINARIRYLDV